MKPRDRAKQAGRRESGNYTGVPYAVHDSQNCARCSGNAIKLLLDITRQFNGYNNGDLCASWSVMRKRGWRSPTTLRHALLELLHFGLIELTRQGGRHAPSLYAVTWCAIDECKGKLDVRATHVPSRAWKVSCEPFKRTSKNRNAATESVLHQYGIHTTEPRKAA